MGVREPGGRSRAKVGRRPERRDARPWERAARPVRRGARPAKRAADATITRRRSEVGRSLSLGPRGYEMDVLPEPWTIRPPTRARIAPAPGTGQCRVQGRAAARPRRTGPRQRALPPSSRASSPQLRRHRPQRTTMRSRTYATSSLGVVRMIAHAPPHRGHNGVGVAPASCFSRSRIWSWVYRCMAPSTNRPAAVSFSVAYY